MIPKATNPHQSRLTAEKCSRKTMSRETQCNRVLAIQDFSKLAVHNATATTDSTANTLNKTVVTKGTATTIAAMTKGTATTIEDHKGVTNIKKVPALKMHHVLTWMISMMIG
jgi:hypothetical protein